MAPIYALTILIAVFAVGEIVAEKTKAMISTVLAIAIILMIAFWTGVLPADVFDIAAIPAISMNLVPLMLAGIGTMIDIPQLKQQWKTVLCSLICMISGVGLIILIGPMLIGMSMTLAGAPIFAGTNAATLIMTAAFNERNMPVYATFVIVVFVTQNLIGIPVSSFLLRMEAKKFIQNPENILKYAADKTEAAAGSQKRLPLQLPPQFSKPSFIFAKLALVACVAFFVSGLTGGRVHFFVAALLVGILFKELGFLEKNVLARTEAFGFIIFATTILIFTNLAQTTPQAVLGMIGPLLITLLLGVVGVVISGLIIGKILGMSPLLVIPIGLTCTYGFPATYLMPKEIGKAIGTNQQEESAIVNYIMPNLIVAGFASVTIASVFVAGFVVGLLPPVG